LPRGAGTRWFAFIKPHLSLRCSLHLIPDPLTLVRAPAIAQLGASILDPHEAEAKDEPLAENAGREWSDGELNELGNMLVRGLSIEEIARRLRRDHGDVRDKVAEVGRACR
jgi:hypothetical protein